MPPPAVQPPPVRLEGDTVAYAAVTSRKQEGMAAHCPDARDAEAPQEPLPQPAVLKIETVTGEHVAVSTVHEHAEQAAGPALSPMFPS
jgi:hypothetical protein